MKELFTDPDFKAFLLYVIVAFVYIFLSKDLAFLTMAYFLIYHMVGGKND